MPDDSFPVLSPDLQVSFYYRLGAIRTTYLRRALQEAVEKVELVTLDEALRAVVPSSALTRVASFGLRGEVVFATPLLLCAKPFLLGYYRLLYGLSQKEFYNKGPFGRFKRLEDRGECSDSLTEVLPALCVSLAQTGSQLVDGLDTLSQEVVHELQLLTVGPQLRGSENTRVGEAAVEEVVGIIRKIVKPCIVEETNRTILITNAANRPVQIVIGSDPDILVTEKLPNDMRYVMSIEIKGGADASNVHNRLGEAEKSHLKAKNLGCVELWTVLRVEIPRDAARRGSPTTTQFFHLDRIANTRTKEFKAFRDAFASRIGIEFR